MPASRCQQSAFARQTGVIGDAPEPHVRWSGENAVLNAAQHFLDDTGAIFAGEISKRRFTLKLAFRFAEPTMRFSAIGEYLFGKHSNSSKPQRLIGFLDRE